MPKITQRQNGGIITFGREDFLAGYAPQHSGGYQSVGNGARSMVAFDPFREYGVASPSYNPSSLTNASVIDVIQKRCVVNNGATPYAYTVGGTKVHQINISTDTITTPTTFPHAVAGSTMEDCIIYRYGGTKYLLYSYYDGTDMEIGTYDFATTFADTWWSGTLGNDSENQNVPHPMIIGPDGNLYIGDGRHVAAIYGDLSQSSTAAVSLPTGWIISSFSKTSNYLIIYAYKSEGYGSTIYRGESQAFFWDLVPDNNFFTEIYDLEDNYVNGGFVWRGIPGCFTYGRSKMGGRGYMGMKLYDGSKFQLIEGCVVNADTPGHGGVEIVDDMVNFLSSGVVYSYGSGISGQKDILTSRNTMSGSTNGGCILNVGSNTIYTSTGTTTSGGMEKISTGYNANALWISTYAFPPFDFDKMGEIEHVQVKFLTTCTGGLSFNLILGMIGQSSTQNVFTDVSDITILSTAESATSKKIITSTQIDASSVEFKDFVGLRISLDWGTGTGTTTAPQVQEVNVFYKNRQLY